MCLCALVRVCVRARVCICVFMCACVQAHACVHVCTHLCVRVRVCVHLCFRVRTCVFVCARMCASTSLTVRGCAGRSPPLCPGCPNLAGTAAASEDPRPERGHTVNGAGQGGSPFADLSVPSREATETHEMRRAAPGTLAHSLRSVRTRPRPASRAGSASARTTRGDSRAPRAGWIYPGGQLSETRPRGGPRRRPATAALPCLATPVPACQPRRGRALYLDRSVIPDTEAGRAQISRFPGPFFRKRQ